MAFGRVAGVGGLQSYGIAIILWLAGLLLLIRGQGSIGLYLMGGGCLAFIAGFVGGDPEKKRIQAKEKSGQVKIDVIQNGPFETLPSGSAWYPLGTRIELKALPTPNHAFKVWASDTKLIEILSPYSTTTVAIAKGSGTITANFSQT